MNNPRFREKVLIGLENAPTSFDVRGKVVGPNGANLQYITNETGAIVTIRGCGSGYIEPNTGQESIEPLHICIEHSKYEVLQAGRQLAFNLIDTVQQEWANLQHQLQQEQQQSQSQPTSVVSSSSSGPPPTQASTESVNVVTSVAPPSSVAVPGAFAQQAVNQMITVPPPQHVAIPPPSLHIPTQLAPPQVSSTNSGSLVAQANESSQAIVAAGTPSNGQEVAVSQASAQPPSISIPHQQQVFLSNQGAIIQPQTTLIPQQQQIITPTGQVISAQPQVLAQSYLLQTNSGQMVVSYPNIMRPAGNTADPGRGQQLMLVQYGEGGSVKTSTMRAPAPQPAPQTVPQMVQIVNPQTGQIQHVLQHIQPQIQMPQAQLQPQILGQGAGLLGQQVLMPIQAPIQFTSQPQQMIIAQHPSQLQHQQQQQLLHTGQTIQHVIPNSTTLNQMTTPLSIVSQKQIVLNIAKQQHGMKRKLEGDQTQSLSILDGMAANSLQNKKGIGAEGVPRPSHTPQQQDALVQSADKSQFVQDDWRRNSPSLAESSDGRGDAATMNSSTKRSRLVQNDQGNEISNDLRAEGSVERFQVAKVESQQQHSQQLQPIYNVATIPQQQQGINVQRQQQQIQQIYQAMPQQQATGPNAQTANGAQASTAQLGPGSYAQQMYPPSLQSSSGQIGAAHPQYVSSPVYNTMPPQQQYTAAPYNPWILPS